MWVCSKCGEPHQDQFKECWKCVGADMEEAPAIADPAPAPPTVEPERPLRSNGSVILRAGIGALVGWCIGFAALQRYGMSATDAATGAGGVALVVGGIVGFFAWVVFPFEPLPPLPDGQSTEAEKTDKSV